MSGIAAETARRFLYDYAWRLDRDEAVAAEQAEHVRWVAEQMAGEFIALRKERDHARDLACRYEAEIDRATRMARELHGELVSE